ncbi:MAG TPA: response regulator transcription factor [Verrucomicrobiae bacterium]|nr:response regulator transcription factor [Verrucomicrobiae bacterium]
MSAKILVVEDEQDVRDLLVLTLRNAGYQTLTAETGTGALRKAASEHPDLILLDLMLPEMSGTEICRRLRADPATANTPVIIVSAKSEEVDKILGLELGADDYVTKPFSPRELVLRIKKLLRRTEGPPEQSDRLAVGQLVVDRSRHQVTFRGNEIILTPTEFKLLGLLIERRGRVQTRDRLLTDVWDYEASMDTRTVDTHVRRLREKLGDAAEFVETVRGVGYRLNDPGA